MAGRTLLCLAVCLQLAHEAATGDHILHPPAPAAGGLHRHPAPDWACDAAAVPGFAFLGHGFCTSAAGQRPQNWFCATHACPAYTTASCAALCARTGGCSGFMIQDMSMYGEPDSCVVVSPNKPAGVPPGDWTGEYLGHGFDIAQHDTEARDCCWLKSGAPAPPGPPPTPGPPVPAGTPIVLGGCDDSVKPPPTRWTTATASMYHTPISRIAVGGTPSGQACLNCPNVGSDCHVWSCEIDLSKISPQDCDRNGLFFLSSQSDGTVQVQTYPDTNLCPVGTGQAGPGFCVTADTRRQGSHLTLEKCDSSIRDQQSFEVADNATGLLQLPSDNAAQPPLPALCVEIGHGGPAPPGPPGPPQPDGASPGMFRVRGPIPWGNNGCLAVAPTPPCNNSWGQDGCEYSAHQ